MRERRLEHDARDQSTYRDVSTTVMMMMRGKAGTPLLSLRALLAPSMGARRQRIVVLVAVLVRWCGGGAGAPGWEVDLSLRMLVYEAVRLGKETVQCVRGVCM